MLATACWHQLPDSMAVHFGFDGTPDSYISKKLAALGLPLLSSLVFILYKFLRRTTKVEIPAQLDYLIMGVLAFISYLATLLILINLGHDFSIIRYILVGINVLLILLWLTLWATNPNKIFGIRTHWTLSSPEVWVKTHRRVGIVAPVLFLLVLISSPWLNENLFAITLAAVFVLSVFYSIFIPYVIQRSMKWHKNSVQR